MRTIRASEIGSFVYCRRAWWYYRQGVEPLNRAELAAGSFFHEEQVRLVRSALILQIFSWILIAGALITIAILITNHFITLR